jgi:RNA polymerase sigma factor (sigma-70 family)
MVGGGWHTVIRQVDRLYAEGTSTAWNDGQLLARFASAREESNLAFAAIVERHGPMVLEVCRRVLGGDHHAAEDAFQATFLALARRAGSIRPGAGGSLGPWLHEVACRTAQKARRTATRREARERRAAGPIEAVVASSQQECEAADEYRVLHEELAGLPEKYRAPIVLCYFEGLTHDQAAESLNWPVGTMRGYLSRARDLLRTRLIRRGVVPAAAVGLLGSPRASAAASLTPPSVDAVIQLVAKGAARASVAALARSIVRGLVIARLQRAAVILLVALVGAGGVGLVASHLQAPAPREGTPGPAAILAPQAAPKPAPPRPTDLYGDSLPDGALARIGTLRFNQGDGVSGVAFTPDGKSLLAFSGGGNGIARFWDPSSGKERHAIAVEELQGGRNFALAPDGTTLLGAERNYEGQCLFRLWDVKTGRESRRQTVPDVSGFSMLAYSPDGKTLATLLADSTVVLWDTATLKELRRAKSTQLNRHHLAWSRDSRMLAIGVDDLLARVLKAQGQDPQLKMPREKGAAILWDVATWREIRRLPAEGCDACSVAFSPDGTMLAASFCDATIRFFNLARGDELARFNVNGRMQSGIVFSPDGKLLASGQDAVDGASGDVAATVHLWDVARRRELRRLPAHDYSVFGMAFSPDGKLLASGAKKVLCLWDVSNGRELFPSNSPRSSIACLVVSPADGSVITGGYDNTIRQWDAGTGRELCVTGKHPQPVYDLAIDPGGRFLVSASLDSMVRLWDLSTGRELHRLLEGPRERPARGLAFSADGRLATAGGKVWEVVTGRELATLRDDEGKEVHPWASAAFTPDAAGLVVTDGSAIGLWDTNTGRKIRELARPGGQISSLTLSPDGRFLASGVEQSIRLWHVASGREVAQPMRHEAKARGAASGYVVVAFSPDGRLLVSGSGGDFSGRDPSVRVWELASCREVRKFDGHRAGVYAVAFFPDGHRIASASADATAIVWDIAQSHRTPERTPAVGADFERLWGDLAGTDAAGAYRAIWALAAAPERVVPFLADRLKPIASDDPAKDISLGPLAKGETLRRLRAIAVLEKIGGPAVRRVLERMASGLDGARETRDARAALRRLRGR